MPRKYNPNVMAVMPDDEARDMFADTTEPTEGRAEPVTALDVAAPECPHGRQLDYDHCPRCDA